MNWQTKARLQNLAAALPSRLGRELYYRFQRITGAFDRVNPATRLDAGRRVVELAEQTGQGLRFSRVLEVGTGYRLNLPIALRLLCADSVRTVDLNPYLRPGLVERDIAWMQKFPEKVEYSLGRKPDPNVWSDMIGMILADRNANSVLRSWGIEYLAPADAASTGLEDNSIDLHTSFTVFEHIPEDVLLGILTEARRILHPSGRAVHFIDLSDHFSHSDSSVSPVNFLRYSEKDWSRLAGNPFMYMNRLRASRYELLFKEAGLKILDWRATANPRATEMVINEPESIDPGFRDLTPEDLAVTSLWIVAARDD